MADRYLDAQMAAALEIGGSSDVEAVLMKLREERESHLQVVAQLMEMMRDPLKYAQEYGTYNAMEIQKRLRSEIAVQQQAAAIVARQIKEIEAAGDDAE